MYSELSNLLVIPAVNLAGNLLRMVNTLYAFTGVSIRLTRFSLELYLWWHNEIDSVPDLLFPVRQNAVHHPFYFGNHAAFYHFEFLITFRVYENIPENVRLLQEHQMLHNHNQGKNVAEKA